MVARLLRLLVAEAVREIVLHVVTETATHAGHLDAARQINGKLRLVLTGWARGGQSGSYRTRRRSGQARHPAAQTSTGGLDPPSEATQYGSQAVVPLTISQVVLWKCQ